MKDIPGYEGLYAITSCGKVWSYTKNSFLKPIIRKKKEKVDYLSVNLWDGKKHKTFYIHRLVAEAYIPNPNICPDVNHKDEIKAHNWMNNLEWCTKSYNINYGSRNQKCSDTRSKLILCIETNEITTALRHSKNIKTSSDNIRRVARGDRPSIKGYHFKYI